MAFRELSQKELELLTDSQQEMYRKKLEIHRERVKFVEHLEKMEHVQIEPFQPTLDPIPPITMAPEKSFVKAEHQVTQVRGVKAVAAQVRARPVPPMEKAVLPNVARAVKAREISVDKGLPAKPVLPDSPSVQMPRGEFKAGKPVKVQVRPVAAVRSPQVIYRSPEAVKAETPAAVSSALRTCPKARIPAPVEKPAAKTSLPKTVTAVPQMKTFGGVTPKMTALPAAVGARPADIAYVAPDTSAAALQPIRRAVCPAKNYQKPMPVRSKLPAAEKMTVRARMYQTPRIQKAEKIKMQSVGIPDRIYKQPAPTNVQVAYPAAVNTPKIDYKKRDYEAQQPLAAKAVSIPDPHTDEILHALLLRAKK